MYDLRHHSSSYLSPALSELSEGRYTVSSTYFLGRLPSNCSCRRTIDGAIKYLHDSQKPEGGWVGCWGICFTYATQFALESLSLVGETYETSSCARRACEFLISKQRADGGWGESYKVGFKHFLPDVVVYRFL